MSVLKAVALGAILAAGGFALGYTVASRSNPGSGTDTAASDPLEAEQARQVIGELIREPATTANAFWLASLLHSLPPEAVPAIKPTLRDPSENIHAAQALLLIQFWVDHDAQGAAKWAARAPFLYRTLALQLAIERLAESDPRAAQRFVGRGTGSETHLLKPLVRGWLRSGEPGLEDWIRDIGLAFERQKALGAYARERIRRQGTAATAAWAEALPDTDDGFKLEVFRRVATELAYADPAAGVAWYQEHGAGPYGDGLQTSVSNAWVTVDGPAAMRWLSQQPAGQKRDDAVLEAVRSWMTGDSDGLIRWAGSPDAIEPWFQPALPIFAKIVAVEDPAEAVRWAARIEDEATRHLTFVQIAERWHALDPAAASAWLAQSPLSESERAKVLEPARPGPQPQAERNPSGS